MKKLLALFMLASSAGCAAISVTLQPPGGSDRIVGRITHGIVEPHHVEITLDGKFYRGEQVTGPADDAVSWPHQRHVGTAHAELTAVDGSRLSCTWTYHGVAGKGACLGSDGREYTMTTQ